MIDTVILQRAVRGILDEEEDNMDARDLKEWLGRIETALLAQGQRQQEQGERIAKVEEKATAAHRRLDEDMRTLKGPGRPAWVGIIVAFLTGLAGVAAAYFGRK